MSIVLESSAVSSALEVPMKHEKYKTFTVFAEPVNLTRIRDFAVKYGDKFGFNLRQLNG